MRLTLITIAGDRTRLQVVSVLQALWQELGILVEIRPESARLLFPDTLQRQNLKPGGVAVWRWVIQPEATVSAYGLWWPKGTNLDQLTPGSPWDAVQENKDLIRKALGTIDDEERYGLLRRQQEVWVRELPTLPLYWHVRVVSMDRRLTGYVPYPDQFLGWGVENWRLGAARGAARGAATFLSPRERSNPGAATFLSPGERSNPGAATFLSPRERSDLGPATF